MTESAAVEKVYTNFLEDFPVEMRPLARSLIVSRIAAYHERPYVDDKAKQAWGINWQFIDEHIKDNFFDKAGVRDRAIWLTTLPKHQDEPTEWYFRWLRGNGLSILADPRMRRTLNTLMDDQEKSKPLTEALSAFLDTDVNGLKKIDLSEKVPEGFSLLASFLIVDSLGYGPQTDNRIQLKQKAESRILNDNEVNRVMDIFGTIEDTKPLFEAFDTYRQEVRTAAVKGE